MITKRNVILNLGTPDKFTVIVNEPVRIPISLNISILEPEEEDESPAGIIIDLAEVKAAAEEILEKELILNSAVLDDGLKAVIFFTENE